MEAKALDAKALPALGRRVLGVVCPEIADAHEQRQLEAEESDVQASAQLSMSRDGHGKAHGRLTIPDAHAAMLMKALNVIAAPKHRHTVTDSNARRWPAELKPTAEKLGRAFCEYIERYPSDRLPDAGGVAAT